VCRCARLPCLYSLLTESRLTLHVGGQACVKVFTDVAYNRTGYTLASTDTALVRCLWRCLFLWTTHAVLCGLYVTDNSCCDSRIAHAVACRLCASILRRCDTGTSYIVFVCALVHAPYPLSDLCPLPAGLASTRGHTSASGRGGPHFSASTTSRRSGARGDAFRCSSRARSHGGQLARLTPAVDPCLHVRPRIGYSRCSAG